MAFPEDIQALKARSDTLQTDVDTLLSQLATALFNRLRPLAALSWMADAALQSSCTAFAATAIRTQIPPPPPPLH